MTAQTYDLLVRAPRLFCADSGLDGPGAVAIRGDRIVASGPGVEGPAHTVLRWLPSAAAKWFNWNCELRIRKSYLWRILWPTN